MTSFIHELASLDKETRDRYIDALGEQELDALAHDWQYWARPEQLTPDGDWNIWLILAGRGWGKTRTLAEDFKSYGLANPQSRMAIVAPTYADARDTCVEGESGLLRCFRESDIKAWNRSLGELVLANETRYKLFSSDEPERLRGPQHHRAWCEELCAWKYPQETWDNLMFGLRLGDNPQAVISTTPKRIKLLLALVQRIGQGLILTKGNTFDNAANLAPTALAELKRRYCGTRIGRQELYAEILDDNERALWKREAMIEALRVTKTPDLKRIVVGVDPSVGDGKDVDNKDLAECGIIVGGLGVDGEGYLLDDKSLMGSPMQWAREAVTAYHSRKADRIVAEVNNGGKLVEAVIRVIDKNVSYRGVHAARGKLTRAEPISSLAEQGKLHHVGAFPKLEDQMCLAGNTLIAYEHGYKRIDEIRQGERVWTRQGLRRVVWAGCTQKEAAVIRLSTANNRYLVATMCHPVYNSKRGEFIPSGLLQQGDTLEVFSCQEDGDGAQKGLMVQPDEWGNMAHKLNGTGGYGVLTGLMATIDMQRVNYCIGPSGRMPMGQSQKIAKFITKTKISKIIDLITCNWLRARSIPLYSTEGGLPGARNNDHKVFALMFGGNDNPKTMYADIVARHSRALTCVPDGVRGDVVARLEAIEERIPVYNIEVEGCHEYYANGILVHNCNWQPGEKSPDRLDAYVWAFTELMLGKNARGGMAVHKPTKQEQYEEEEELAW